MKSRTIITFTCLILTILAINSQFTDVSPSIATNTANYSGLRVNRVILNSNNLTFIQNDKISIFMLVENIGTQPVNHLNFNYTVDTALFSIIQSSNTTQSSNKTVYYNFGTLNPGNSFSFNMTLQVVSNKTETITLQAVTIYYDYSEFNLPGSISTSTLKINIQENNTNNTLTPKVLGTFELNQIVLALLIAFPIIIGFGLSFYFGRRRNKL